MPVGLEKLKKTNKPEDPIEKLISRGLFEEAAEILNFKGFKKFASLVGSLNDTLPYISEEMEERFKIRIIRAFRHIDFDTPDVSKADTMAFSTLEDAMRFLSSKIEENKKEEIPREVILDQKRLDKEKLLLKPRIKFVPVVYPPRISVAYADVIIIGKRPKIIDALHEYDYVVEGFARDQVIIRNVLLLAIHGDSLYTPLKKGDAIIKPKPKKGSWQDILEKRRRKPKFLARDIALIVSRNKRLRKLRVVSGQYIRHRSFVYMLLLPPTLITPPFCEQKQGKIIPLVESWGILGMDTNG